MIPNTTPASLPAIPERYATIPLAGGRVARPDVLVWLDVAGRPWGRLETTPHQLWNAFLDDAPLVMRHRDPEHESCRELLARGVTGAVAFIQKATGQPSMVMDIVRGAGLTTIEDDRCASLDDVPAPRRVRHVARLFLSKPSERAQAAYWRSSVCQKLYASMIKNGISADEANRQLEAFRLAVGVEMHLQMHGTRERM